MRTPFFLSTALVASLSGCTSAQMIVHEPADSVVDAQIAQSASAISLAQLRLHQTSPAPPVAPVPSKPATALPASMPVASAGKPAGLIAPAPKPAEGKTVAPAKAFPATSTPVVTPVVATPVPEVKAVASTQSAKPVLEAAKTSSAVAVSPAVVSPKVIPASPVPPVVIAKAAPKPVEAPWVVSPGDATLRRALAKWSARAGWQLVWEASVDVPINVTATFTGDFRAAVKSLFQSLSAADVNLSGLLYSGNKVLRVTESGRRAQ